MIYDKRLITYLRNKQSDRKIREIRSANGGKTCIETVFNKDGKEIGQILYDLKLTQDFYPAWVAKMADDVKKYNTGAGIIISNAYIGEARGKYSSSNVWICTEGDLLHFRMKLIGKLMTE